MKAGVKHVVPLSDAAMDVLVEVKPEILRPELVIFAVEGAARSNMAMTMLLRRMGRAVTVHGMRSTFRDWAGDATEFPRELIEQALAHTISDKAERAYRRGTGIERRGAIMNRWADYLSSSQRKS
jgi:integrase